MAQKCRRTEILIPWQHFVSTHDGATSAHFKSSGTGTAETVGEIVSNGHVNGFNLQDGDVMACLVPRHMGEVVLSQDIEVIPLVSPKVGVSLGDNADLALTYLPIIKGGSASAVGVNDSPVSTGVTNPSRYTVADLSNERNCINEMTGGKIAGGTLTTRDSYLKILLTCALDPASAGGFSGDELRFLGVRFRFTEWLDLDSPERIVSVGASEYTAPESKTMAVGLT